MKHRYSLLIFLCSLFAVSCSQGETATDGESEYPLMTLKREDRRLTEEYSAVIRGLQDVEVRPQVSGTITQVCVNEGAEVKQGQVLFVIDQVPYKAAVEVAKAAVATAEAAEEIARQTLEGKEMLHTEKVISDFDLRTAQNEYKSAQAATMQARAELVNAQNNLSYTEVIGTLVSYSMSEPLISVSDNSQMLAYFSLVEKQVLSLTRQYGSLDKVLSSFPDVSLRLNDGTIYEHTGKIDVISGIIDKTTGAVSLRAKFDNRDGRLMSGGQANVIVPYDRPGSIVIPQEATYEIQNRIFAYKVVDGIARSTAIEVFAINDGREYIVESGLEEGDVIVSEGAGLLKDGTRVTNRQQASASKADSLLTANENVSSTSLYSGGRLEEAVL